MTPLSGDRKPKETKTALADVNRQLEEQRTAKDAQVAGLAYVDLVHVPINPDVFQVVPVEEMLRALAVPFFKVGKKLRLALADPAKQESKDLIQRLTEQGYKITISLASLSGITELIQKIQGKLAKVGPGLAAELVELDVGTYAAEIASLNKLKEKFQEASSADALQLLLVGAVRTDASDIHLESKENALRVRFRIDGVLHDIFDVALDVASQLISQLKYQAGLKLNVTDVPQDGRMTFRMGESRTDLRVNVMPTTYGETFVMRLLPHERKMLQLEDLGLRGKALELVNKALAKPTGMILCTGPTGSGKTTTLYTMLNKINQPETKIITLEDPVEYRLEGIVQSQIHEDKGYTFAGALRASLRQDPDVIMVGEIRDIETAKTAAQAAMTGHLVFSTLHTNDALATIPRLVNMELPSYMIASSLSLVIAQRLVRRLCPKCQVGYHASESIQQEYKVAVENAGRIIGQEIMPKPELLKGQGCEACSNTGYKGQVGLYEVFLVDRQLAEMILQEKSLAEIRKYLMDTQNIFNIPKHCALKVHEGLTTMEEVLSVTAAE